MNNYEAVCTGKASSGTTVYLEGIGDEAVIALCEEGWKRFNEVPITGDFVVAPNSILLKVIRRVHISTGSILLTLEYPRGVVC